MPGSRRDMETYAVGKINDLLCYSERVSSYINSGDKEATWDGSITISKKGTTDKDKKDDIQRIPVQVKGVSVNKLSKNKKLYHVREVDMNNFYNDGGVLYLVVERLEKNIEEYKIFYKELLPIEIPKLINESKDIDSVRIYLKEIEKNDALLLEVVCDTFLINREYQYSLKKCKINIDKATQYKLVGYGRGKNLTESFINNDDITIYAKKAEEDDPLIPFAKVESTHPYQQSTEAVSLLIEEQIYIIENSLVMKSTLDEDIAAISFFGINIDFFQKQISFNICSLDKLSNTDSRTVCIIMMHLAKGGKFYIGNEECNLPKNLPLYIKFSDLLSEF